MEQTQDPALAPVLDFRLVRTNVIRTGEHKDRIPDLLVAELPGGLLVGFHGTKRALAYVPGLTYKDLGVPSGS